MAVPRVDGALLHMTCMCPPPHFLCVADPRVDGALLHTAMLHHTLAENKNFLLPLDHDRLHKIQTASGRGGILGGGGALGAVPYIRFSSFSFAVAACLVAMVCIALGAVYLL